MGASIDACGTWVKSAAYSNPRRDLLRSAVPAPDPLGLAGGSGAGSLRAGRQVVLGISTAQEAAAAQKAFFFAFHFLGSYSIGGTKKS